MIQKKRWTLRKVLIGGGAILISALILYAITGADYSSSFHIEKDKLNIATVNKGAFNEFITVDGILLPLTTVYLDAVEGGVVEKKIVEDGAPVHKNDPIIMLSNGNLQLDYINRETQILDLLNQIENARAGMIQNRTSQFNQLADMEYQIKQASRKFSQNKALIEKKVISQNDYRQSEEEYEYLATKLSLIRKAIIQDSLLAQERIHQMDFSVKRMRENLDIVKKNLENLIVRAPADGQLTSFDIQQGQLIQKGQSIAQIDLQNGFKVRATVDEHYINRVYAGQQGSFELDGKVFRLSVKKIDPQVKNGFFLADMKFEDSLPAGIKKGQNINIRLELSAQSTALLLDKGGFAQSSGGNWAFVLDKTGNQAIRRNIKIGRQNPQYFEVLGGLEKGEQVVVSSYAGFENKDKLILK